MESQTCATSKCHVTEKPLYAPATTRLMLEGKQVSRGNRGMKLMLEALYRLYQEAFLAWMQQRDQTDLRRNDMYTLVRDIQQAFAETGNPLDYYPNS